MGSPGVCSRLTLSVAMVALAVLAEGERGSRRRIAALITGHCDSRSHVCGPVSWQSAAEHVLVPLASSGRLDVYVCSPNTSAAYNEGFRSAFLEAGGTATTSFQFVDAFASENDVVVVDRLQQIQFKHRLACSGQGRASGASLSLHRFEL